MNELIKSLIIVNLLVNVGLAITPDEILERADATSNSPKDQVATLVLKIIDKKGFEQDLEIVMQQKGNDMRTAKFLEPAEKKGIAFLSLPGDMFYLYLPAFKKVRRIASHLKNTKFAGTDFTYEDMGAMNYSEKWKPTLDSELDDKWILELTPRSGVSSEYSKMRMTVEKDNFFPVLIEYFDKSGKQCKLMKREQIEKIDGYLVARRSELFDPRSGNRTVMTIKEIVFDSGLGDELFTERYLER